MFLKMFSAVSGVLLCIAGLVFGQNQLVDDFTDGDSLNRLGYPWYYFDDNTGIADNDRPQAAPASIPSIINVPYTEEERHAFGDPNDHHMIKKYTFATGTDILSNRFATMPFTLGESFTTSAGWDMYSYVGMGTALALEGGSIDLSGVTKIRFKIRSRNRPLSFNFKVQTFEIDSISSGDAEALSREDNNPFGYYGVWDSITTTDFSEFVITINGGSNGRGNLTAPTWAVNALPYNSKRVTKLTWEINSDMNSTVTSDTLDIDDLYFDRTPVVSLISPLNAAINVTIDPMMRWSNSANTTENKVLISTVSDFSSTFREINLSPAQTTTTLTGLTGNTTYYWKVKATALSGDSVWSPSWSFTTLPPPSIPVLSTPANLATDVYIPATLTWVSTSGAQTYNLQVATDAGFTDIISSKTGLTTLSTSVTGLNENTVYYWRVSATNGAGTSDWSISRAFTTSVSVPNAPTLSSPDDNVSDIPVTSIFIWNQLSNAASYTIQVSADISFNELKIDQTGLTDTTFAATTELLNGRKYYWRVQGVNIAGSGSFSSVRTFITEYAIPAAPTLVAPTTNAINVSPAPTLRWETDTAIGTTFDVEASKNNSFLPTVYSSPSLRGFSVSISGLEENTVYHWRVRAKNAAGPGPWAQDSFTTYQSILLGDFENGHHGTEVGTSWYFYNDSGSGGNSVINNADPQSGQFLGGYTPGNASS
ncbi:MAG TPA: fibronectin type III domain-containing protein, partial [Chitinispirillaceae bacterium]|nr:fibronectin type III domain-containing protein [Chitinispirillaceae bacterium]